MEILLYNVRSVLIYVWSAKSSAENVGVWVVMIPQWATRGHTYPTDSQGETRTSSTSRPLCYKTLPLLSLVLSSGSVGEGVWPHHGHPPDCLSPRRPISDGQILSFVSEQGCHNHVWLSSIFLFSIPRWCVWFNCGPPYTWAKTPKKKQGSVCPHALW